jgi:RimJ/RimL family protein N-acetyltransferase
MAWSTTDDPDEYLDAAGAFLRAEPAANSVILTAAETLREGGGSRGGPAALLGWWREPGGDVAGAFLHTPPYPAAVSAMPDGAAEALAATFDGAASPTAVSGDARATRAFAAAWCARTGARSRVKRRMRLHRLRTLVPPDPPPPGRAVLATAEHRGVAIAWYEAFSAEIHEVVRDIDAAVDDRLGHGGIHLWVLDDDRPVALAAVTRTIAGTARVAPVYTPPEERGRGYGAGATFAVTRAAIDAGAREVVLYTDLDNPTSNRLYARLGFEPVEDRDMIAFEA